MIMTSIATISPLSMRPRQRPVLLAVIAGLACAWAAGKTMPLTMDEISGVLISNILAPALHQ
jgi:hypothetical protein